MLLNFRDDKDLQLKFRQLKITTTGGTSKEFKQADFWGPNATYPVNYTCPDKSVLVGIEMTMLGANGVRTPTYFKFTCKELQP